MPATPRASTTMLPSSERTIVAGAMNASPQPIGAQRPIRRPCASLVGVRRSVATTSLTVEELSADSDEPELHTEEVAEVALLRRNGSGPLSPPDESASRSMESFDDALTERVPDARTSSHCAQLLRPHGRPALPRPGRRDSAPHPRDEPGFDRTGSALAALRTAGGDRSGRRHDPLRTAAQRRDHRRPQSAA